MCRTQKTLDWIDFIFDRSCESIDEQISKISSLHDVQMTQRKKVRFQEIVETREVQPYPETLPDHPHFIVATPSGWKKVPTRSDPLTGKSSNVMQASRQQLRLKFGSRSAKGRRRSLLKKFNNDSMEFDKVKPMVDFPMPARR